MRTPCRAVFSSCALATLLASNALTAQEMAWRPVWSGPTGRVAVFDAVRERITLFGGEDDALWEWDGSRWGRRPTEGGPRARYGHAMAYDPTRRRIVLFGGVVHSNGDPSDETWEWDGAHWHLHHPTTRPARRSVHAMAYDETRGRTVLFGGEVGPPPWPGDTWEWDGSDWQQRSPPTQPAGRAGHSLVFDAARGRVLMVGGVAAQRLDETWGWDGVDWRRLFPAHSPASGSHAGAAYDSHRQRVVLFGGGYYSDATWEWDGTDWIDRTTAVAPSGRIQPAMAYDARRRAAVLFGGDTRLGDTWAWNGSTWRELAPAVRPVGVLVEQAVFASPLARVLVYVGSPMPGVQATHDVWSWDGAAWERHDATSGPSLRWGHAIAYDTARRRLVLFGGTANNTEVDDTWEWDGTRWHAMQPPVVPWRRTGHAMAYDPIRRCIVLRGGGFRSGRTLVPLGDTWEWDGTVWTLRHSSMYGTYGHALAFDPGRGRMLSHGGGTFAAAGLEQWDGTAWTAIPGSTGTDFVYDHSLVVDPGRGRILVTGGRTQGPWRNPYTWEWDGTQWTKHPDPLAWQRGAAVYDERIGRMVAVGDDAWLYDADPGPRAIDFGAGCNGSRGVPILTSFEPRLGSRAFRLDLHSIEPLGACVFGLATSPGAARIGACTLWLGAPALALPAPANAAGFASVPLPLPHAVELRGVALWAQGGVLAPQPSPYGFALSGGRALRLGY